MSLTARMLLVALLVLTVAGCRSGSSISGETGAQMTSASLSPPAAGNGVPAIVGRWTDVHSCRTLVRAFRSAGLGALAPLQAAAFGSDRPNAQQRSKAELEARAQRLRAAGHLCAGAHAPFTRSLFFNLSGIFGSIQGRMPNDTNTYRVHGQFLRIGKSKFRYRVRGNGRLTLTPLITRDERQRALDHPTVFTTAVWMVTLAYAGSTWHRAPCQGWC